MIRTCPKCGAYYADDLRNVLENGVSHVMGLFMKHVADERLPAPRQETPAQSENVAETAANDQYERAAHLVQVECDEAGLDPDQKAGSGK